MLYVCVCVILLVSACGAPSSRYYEIVSIHHFLTLRLSFFSSSRIIEQVVLDESSEAAARARANANMRIKFKERMANIKRALYVRTIVEDEEYDKMEEDDEEGGGRGCSEDNPPLDHRVIVVTEEDDAIAIAAPALVGCRDIITIEEDDDEDDGGDEGAAGRREPVDSSPRATTTTTATTTTRRDPPRLSLSSPRRYTDALNCGGRRPHFPDALSCDRSAASCEKNNAVIGEGGGSVTARPRPSFEAGASAIAITSIVSTYGEECNICLSQFQVGDHAAWSSRHGMDDREADVFCKHVFHEECITRWLLVRDRCPICRESYVPETNSSIGTIATPANVGQDLEQGGGGDDGVTVEEITSTPLVRRIIERFGSAQ